MELVAGPGGVMFWSMSYDPEAGKTTQGTSWHGAI